MLNHGRALILFMLLVVGGGLAIGYLTAPGAWYANLAKPRFNPPNWMFAPVWTVLYVLIAVVGWRTLDRDGSSRAMKLWWVQLALNFLWSPIFFGAHQIGLGLLIIVLMLATILVFIALSSRRDRIAAWLFVPYAAWVAFALVLNASILFMNHT